MSRVLLGLVLCSLLAACGGKSDESAAGGAAATPFEGLFEDVTAASGLDFVHQNGAHGVKYLPEIMGSGGCALDYDGDGDIDVYLVQSGPVPGATGGPTARASNRLFRNRGDGTFEDVTEASGAGDQGYGMGAVAADHDGDGDVDVYVVNLGPNVLLRNEGDGTFVDVTEAAGVGNSAWGSSATFFDADGDEDLDLYVANYVDFAVERHVRCGPPDGEPSYCHPDVYPGVADILYVNVGGGRFEDATSRAGMGDPPGKGLGVVAADLDGDGTQDVYVANDSTPNFLYCGRGDGTFADEGILQGVSHNEEGDTEAGMGVDVGDVDGNGRPDILVTNLAKEANALYLRGDDEFSYATRIAGLHHTSFPWVGFGVDLADLDNDGDLDVFVANGHVLDTNLGDGFTFPQPDQVFLGDGRGSFRELSAAQAGDVAAPRVGRGAITFDFDDDGRLDVLVCNNGDRARLFRNRSRGGAWLGLHLVNRGPNRDAIGAVVRVTANGRTLTAWRLSGAGYQTSHDPRMHFGLGAAAAANVTVRWPDGEETKLGSLSANASWRIERGRAPVRK